MTRETTFIYALLSPDGDPMRRGESNPRPPVNVECPDTWHGRVFYVGKANKPRHRLWYHQADRARKTPKGHWIAGLVGVGLKPLLAIVEECPYSVWQERERYWQDLFLTRGEPLTNLCECGMGANAGLFTHGKSHTREYRLWHQLRGRCEDPKNRSYKKYGAKGVAVCDAWQVFDKFLADVGEAPSSQHVLHRIDKSGPYSADNCRWLTPAEGRRLPPNAVNGECFLETKDVARQLGICLSETRKLLAQGQIQGEHHGRTWFVRESALAAFMKTHLAGRRQYEGIVTPGGRIVSGFTNMRQFCQENELNYSRMHLLYHGKILSYKEWTCQRPEALAALAAAKRMHSPETIAKMRKATLGRTYEKRGPRDESTLAKIRQALLENGVKKNALTINGETRSLNQWAVHCGICLSTLKGRLANGWDPERAVHTPKQGERGEKVWCGFFCPDGTHAGAIRDLKALCHEQKLDYAAMRRVHSGEARSHQGWTCPDSAKAPQKPGPKNKEKCRTAALAQFAESQARAAAKRAAREAAKRPTPEPPCPSP